MEIRVLGKSEFCVFGLAQHQYAENHETKSFKNAPIQGIWAGIACDLRKADFIRFYQALSWGAIMRRQLWYLGTTLSKVVN